MSKGQDVDHKPDPGDLEEFLPWVSKSLQVPFDLQIERIVQRDYTSGVASERGKTQTKSVAQVSTSTVDSDRDKDSAAMSAIDDQNILFLTLIYDHSENLTGLKLDKSKTIPREIIKILGLVIQFHATLTSVIINKGLNASVMYELCKILPLSKITDINLDDCFLEEGNYYILLENNSCLRNLSLSKCKIGDVVVGMIASRLVHPLPGSKLIILNLSTNRISDIGAKSIGIALRANMKLAYLNLADNMITDKGAEAILESFLEFQLSQEELLAARLRNVNYLKARYALIADMLTELKADLDFDKRGLKKRKTITPLTKKVKGGEREGSLKNIGDKSTGELDALFLEKAEAMAMETLGPFKDPHSNDNVISRDGMVFCQGNKSLCYVSLAYNSLTFSSAKKMLAVLKHQNVDKAPRGLVNVCLEGNPLPVASREMSLIDEILDSGLNSLCKRFTNNAQKKKPGKVVKA